VVEYELAIPWFRWLFALPARVTLGRPRRGVMPWWAPPDRLDERQVLVLGLLAAASLCAAFVNTLFTQTVAFAARDFGVSNAAQGVAGAVVRIGVLVAIPVAIAADRVGRRRMMLVTAVAAPVLAALGAASPTFPVLAATQTLGRPMGLALDVLIAIVAAEEMPRNARAYAVSVLILASGLGAGICVMALPLADVAPWGWRLVYVVAVVWLIVALDLARRLPETARFEARRPERPPLQRGRLRVQLLAAFLGNLFVAPASFFQNRYLTDVRGFDGSRITLFVLSTATPAGIGVLIGGRLADRFGRRVLGAVCLLLSTVFVTLAFGVAGWPLWVAAFLGGAIGGAAAPALAVYRAELFPTGSRGRAGVMLLAAALLSGSISLVVMGALLDRGFSHLSVLAVLALAEVAVAVLVVTRFPETAHRELEEINPEDVPRG
jgi:MFS family permease